MGEREPLKTVLFTNYSAGTAELLRALLKEGTALSRVVFAPGEIRRLPWRTRLMHFLSYGDFREPRAVLARAGIPFSFVASHNDDEAKMLLQGADLLLLYGTKIIKSDVLLIPKIGVLNAHSALLPRYRGTKVEFWILYNREPQYAGVTIHWVSPGLDEGDIFLQEPLAVSPGETPESLRAKSVPLAGKLFADAISRIERGAIIRIPQDNALATKVKRPTAEEIASFNARKPND